MTVLAIVLSLIGFYFVAGIAVIGAWEIITEIKDAYSAPTWLDNAYYFVINKWFFFLN